MMRYLLLFLLPLTAAAQITKPVNRPLSDSERFQFGFAIGIERYVSNEKTVTVTTGPGTGFGLEVEALYKIFPGVRLRFMPRLSFEEAAIKAPVSNVLISKKIESTFLSFPLDAVTAFGRKNNWQPYLVAGGLIRNDLAGKGDGWKPAIRGGLGFNFHLPYFTLQTEARAEYGPVFQNQNATTGWFSLIFSG
jgi:hypothetical protein